LVHGQISSQFSTNKFVITQSNGASITRSSNLTLAESIIHFAESEADFACAICSFALDLDDSSQAAVVERALLALSNELFKP